LFDFFDVFVLVGRDEHRSGADPESAYNFGFGFEFSVKLYGIYKV